MKILYVTDTHLRGTTPRGRLDDLPATLLAKLREVVSLAKTHQVTAILHGGDLFDRPDVAPAVALEYLRVLADAPCPVYAIPGNHDLFGFNPETIPRTMLGLFDGAGLVRLIRPGEPVWLEADGLKVQVTGQPFHAELDRRDPRLDYCVRPASPDDLTEAGATEAGATEACATAPAGLHVRHPSANFAIHLTHGMLLERPFVAEVAHTLLTDVMPHTVADVTFGGHYHAGWSQVYEQDGRLFINPGALVRLGTHAGDVDRTVSVVLLELSPGTGPVCRLLPLAAARPAAEVIDRSQEEAQMARERAMADFIMGVGDLSRFEVVSVQEIMRQVAETAGAAPGVTAEALRRLGEAQANLAQDEEASPT